MLETFQSTARTRVRPAEKLASMLSRFPEEVWARAPHDPLAEASIRSHDVAILMQPHVGRYAPLIQAAGVPIILDCQNVEFEVAGLIARVGPRHRSRIRLGIDALKWRRFEAFVAARAQLLVAVSHSDARQLRTITDRNVVIHPNGADVEHLPMQDHRVNRSNSILMTGTLGYVPNMDAAKWMTEDILPIIRSKGVDARLDLVGAAPPTWFFRSSAPGVAVHGDVPDVLPYYEAADVFVAPLRAGGGTRLKILEALTLGIPVVATSLGAAGLDVVHERDLLLADDADSFAAAVVRAMEDQILRARLIENGRELVVSRYDWRGIAKAYELDILRVVQNAAPRRSDGREASRNA